MSPHEVRTHFSPGFPLRLTPSRPSGMHPYGSPKDPLCADVRCQDYLCF